MFYRRETDGTRTDVALRDLYSTAFPAPCWVIGGGPSLATLDLDEIRRSPAPKFAINLAGSGLIRPNFWTSYDPTRRFHRSIYLDPGILKFVHASRAMDLVPETRIKVCEAPGLLFFERDRQRGFHNFPAATTSGVTDWQDSLIQAIDIAWLLGFRDLYLAGCEMHVPPGEQLVQRAAAAGVTYRAGQLLRDFLRQCREAGVPIDDPESMLQQYHFDEMKPLEAASQTDFHYFRVAQYLRLSRRAMSRSGLRLVSVTPGSRLNEDFPFLSVSEAAQSIRESVGDPESESTRGRYTLKDGRRQLRDSPMKDFPPHNWPEKKRRPVPRPGNSPSATPSNQNSNIRAANDRRRELEDLREIAVDIRETG